MFKLRRSLFVAVWLLGLSGCTQAQDANSDVPPPKLSIGSPALSKNAALPRRFTCQGKAISPPLTWSGIPKKAYSLVLILDDPDAPGGTWTHWILFNLPTSSTGLQHDATPPDGSSVGQNSWHKPGYGAPCPPSGSHRYVFKLYALDTRLDLKKPNHSALLEAMRGHVITHTQFITTYKKHPD